MRPHAFLLLSLLAAACGSGGADDGGGDDGQEPGPGAADAAPVGEAAPSYRQDVQPILASRCGPCHTSGNAGGVNHASEFAATRRPSNACAGQMVYECILVRVQDGSMPPGAGCSGDPEADEGNPSCLTAEEHAILADWVAAGAPEDPAVTPPPAGPDPAPYPY